MGNRLTLDQTDTGHWNGGSCGFFCTGCLSCHLAKSVRALLGTSHSLCQLSVANIQL